MTSRSKSGIRRLACSRHICARDFNIVEIRNEPIVVIGIQNCF
jgi:hypothetical protein